MEVDASVRRQGEERPAELLAEARGHDHVGRRRADLVAGVAAVHVGGLEEGEVELRRREGDRGRTEAAAAARLAVGGRHDEHRGHPGAGERAQGRHGELGRPHEDDARPDARDGLGGLERVRGEVAVDGRLGAHRVLVDADRDPGAVVVLARADLAQLDELEEREERPDEVGAVGPAADEVGEGHRPARGDEALEDDADEVGDREALAGDRDGGLLAGLAQQLAEGGDEGVEVGLDDLVGLGVGVGGRAHGEAALLLAGARVERARRVLEALVGQQLLDEVEPRVEVVLLLDDVAGQERPALQDEQVARHDEELARAVDVERGEPRLEVLDELVGDLGERELVDVHLGLLPRGGAAGRAGRGRPRGSRADQPWKSLTRSSRRSIAHAWTGRWTYPNRPVPRMTIRKSGPRNSMRA